MGMLNKRISSNHESRRTVVLSACLLLARSELSGELLYVLRTCRCCGRLGAGGSLKLAVAGLEPPKLLLQPACPTPASRAHTAPHVVHQLTQCTNHRPANDRSGPHM